MTTKQLEEAAQKWLENYLRDRLHPGSFVEVADALGEFALAQLRRQLADLERMGYAGHKDDCARFRHPHYKLQCDCRWDEMKRELEAP